MKHNRFLKSLAITIGFALIWLTNSAQTLQFSQVKLVTSSETVPAGKVWKITNMLSSARLSSSAVTTNSAAAGVQTVSAASEQMILINSVPIYLSSSNTVMRQIAGGSTPNGMSVGGDGTSGSAVISPIWLPETTILAPSTGVYGLSVVEFTVVP